MIRKKVNFKFNMIGDLLMNRKMHYDAVTSDEPWDTYYHSPLAARRGEMTINLTPLLWIHSVQVWDFDRIFDEREPMNRFKRTVFDRDFSNYAAIIFTSPSLDQSQQLLQDYNMAYLFKAITEQTPVFIVVNDPQEMTKLPQYYELLSQYCDTLNLGYMSIYHLEANIGLLFEKIQQDFLLLANEKLSSRFRLCVVCHDNQQKLYIHDNFIICDSCDPKDIDENKVRAWLKLDR